MLAGIELAAGRSYRGGVMQVPFTYCQLAKKNVINFIWFSLNPPGFEAFRKKTLILESLDIMWMVTTERLRGNFPPPSSPRWTARRFTPPERMAPWIITWLSSARLMIWSSVFGLQLHFACWFNTRRDWKYLLISMWNFRFLLFYSCALLPTVSSLLLSVSPPSSSLIPPKNPTLACLSMRLVASRKGTSEAANKRREK